MADKSFEMYKDLKNEETKNLKVKMEEPVKVFLGGVILNLEDIAKDSRKIKGLSESEGIYHFVTLPEQFAGLDFLGIAKDAVDYMNSMSQEDLLKAKVDAELVKEGYNLLKSGQIHTMVLGKNK